MKQKKTTAIIFAVGIGSFMSALDSSAVNLAMPMMKEQFGVSLSTVEWIAAAYLLVVSSLLLTFGRMSDLYGHKKVYTTGFAIFTFSSLLCGLAFNINILIACRVLQALGAGMLFATGPAIITNAVPATVRGKALSVTAITVALGLCAGPVVGGMLSTLLGWQSIFYINLPIGILGMAIVMKTIPEDEPGKAGPFDIWGSVLIFAALLLILLPLNLSGDHAFPPALFASLIGLGFLLIGAFILREMKYEHPMLNLDLFRNRVFAASNAAAVFTYMAQFIMTFLIPFYFQHLKGYSALVSGLIFTPMPISTMLIAPLSGTASDRYDSRIISSTGNLIMALGLFLISRTGADTSLHYLILCMVVTGIGFGMFQTPNNSAIMGNVPSEYRGIASGTLATMRNIGMVTGIAISGALFSMFEKKGLSLFSLQGQTGELLTSSAFLYALQITLRVAAAVSFAAMLASLTKGKVKPGKAN